MNSHLFLFKTTWSFPCDLKTVWDSIAMVAHYPLWWPGIIQVEILKGQELPVAVGSSFRFFVVSPLYRLSYTTTVTDYAMGRSIIARVEGDLVGRGVWTFEEVLGETKATFIWEVELTPFLLRVASRIPAIRSVMRFFHNRLMDAGERGLRELLVSIP